MAFNTITVRLPDSYIKYVKDVARALGESEGFIVQQMVYKEGNGKLPPPRRRDRKQEETE